MSAARAGAPPSISTTSPTRSTSRACTGNRASMAPPATCRFRWTTGSDHGGHAQRRLAPRAPMAASRTGGDTGCRGGVRRLLPGPCHNRLPDPGAAAGQGRPGDLRQPAVVRRVGGRGGLRVRGGFRLARMVGARACRCRTAGHHPPVPRPGGTPMKESFLKSMAWLHTWSGLLVGWLLFVIFVGGTIACFDAELDDWMRPALHATAAPQTPRFDAAFALSRQQAPDAHVWWAHRGDSRDRALESYWVLDDGTEGQVALDPGTGEPVPGTAGGEFFFTLHYNLHAGLPGMYLVGLAGMLMLVALIAGVLIHKRI